MTELNPCQSKNALSTVTQAREDFIQDYCNSCRGDKSEFNSEYSRDNWEFIANEQSRGISGWKGD